MSPEQNLEKFQKEFENFVDNPQVCGTVDEFHGYKEEYCGLWVSGEEGNSIDGRLVFTQGYDSPIDDFLDKWNAHYEWYDNGTVMIYLDGDAN